MSASLATFDLGPRYLDNISQWTFTYALRNTQFGFPLPIGNVTTHRGKNRHQRAIAYLICVDRAFEFGHWFFWRISLPSMVEFSPLHLK